MTTAPVDHGSPASAPIAPMAARAPAAAPAVDRARRRLSVICASHAVVDFFSAIIIPLLTVLEGRLGLAPAQGAALIAVGSLASGLVQPAAAWISDRLDTRLPGILGAGLAVVAIGLIGFATTYEQLLVLQILGTAGIGAFHPVAAASMGQLSGLRRSMGVTVFFTAGMVGGIAGSLFGPGYVKGLDLPALAWTIPPGLVAVVLLSRAIRRIPHRHHDAHNHHRALGAHERRLRWFSIWILFAANALRFTVNMALVHLAVRYAEAVVLGRAGAAALDGALRTEASLIAGPLQAALQIGMGVAGLAIGLGVRPRYEKAAMVLVPTLGAAAVFAMPYTPWPASFAVAVACGAGFAGVIPMTIAVAQRLLPHRTSLASSLMMGGAWTFATAGPPLAQWLIGRTGLAGSFAVSGVMLLAAGLLSLALPQWLILKSAGLQPAGSAEPRA